MILQALSELRPNCNVEVVFNNDGSYTITRYQHEEPQPTEEEIQAKIAELRAAESLRLLRIQRDQLLQQSDWTQNRDIQLSNDAEWLTYRQALRDLPSIAEPLLDENGNLTNVNWPERPE